MPDEIIGSTRAAHQSEIRQRYDVSKHNIDRIIHLPDAEISGRYREGETIAELAKVYGCSTRTILRSLHRTATPRRPTGQQPGKSVGDLNPNWSGGRWRRRDGYWVVSTPDGEKLEHRAVVEARIGRRLREDEYVHHRDCDKGNNDPANLEVMSPSEHTRYHSRIANEARLARRLAEAEKLAKEMRA